MTSRIDPASPFGGYKQSGWGREMGREAIDQYTKAKAGTVRLYLTPRGTIRNGQRC